MTESTAPEHDLAAWLRLTLISGIGGESQRKLLAAFGLPERIFSAGRAALTEVIGNKAKLLLDTAVEDEVTKALRWREEPGQRIITLADADYPPSLLQTPNPPALLYVRGDVALLQKPALAIVGSRNATPQGIRIAEDFAKTLTEAGFAIVSGLALGIDAAAHRGALKSPQGATIAVIGTGADRIYPARNQELAREVARRGVILSEFPLGTPALAANFPRRNRIISGLTRGVLVVEATIHSGSLITARLAGETGREVFAIPGSIHSPFSKGCHHLIKQGAKLVESAQDILEELGAWQAEMENAPKTTPDVGASETVNAESDPIAAQILTQLGGAPCALDELALATGLAADALLPVLLSLELEDKIAPLPGNRYQRLS
ncbi:MAG: DNA-processing protein DprA [Zoogloeaceae bacterium]|jgi:DNA processing protein|nr:DNA-processing protein DprA [Zoogloeaceae bacterium]